MIISLAILLMLNTSHIQKMYQPNHANQINPILITELLPIQDTLIETAMTIKIDSTMNYFINGIKADFKDLEKQLENHKIPKNAAVELEIDKTVPFEKVIQVMNICRKHHLKLVAKTNE